MKWIYYSFQEMGIIRYIPIITLCVMSLLCRNSLAETTVILKAFELFLPPFAIFWIIPLFFNYVNAGTKEVYLSYPYSRKRQGMLRVLLIMLWFDFFMLVAFFIAISSWKEYCLYLLILCVQTFFYVSLGFLLIVMTKNIVVSIGIILAYVGLQVLDSSHIFYLIGLCFYDIINGPIHYIVLKMAIIFIISMFFFVHAQRRFDCMDIV